MKRTTKYDPVAAYRNSKQRAEEAVAPIVNAGHATKAKQKEALSYLGWAYDRVSKMHDDIVMTAAREAHPIDIPARMKELDEKSLPMNLHQVREAKHKAAAMLTGFWSEIDDLVTMREAVKGVEIVPFSAKEPSTEAIIKARVLKSFRELSEDRRKTFDWASEIVRTAEEIKPGVKLLPVSVSHVYCSNSHGTDWVRIDWYLEGKRLPFNTLLAAIEADERASA